MTDVLFPVSAPVPSSSQLRLVSVSHRLLVLGGFLCFSSSITLAGKSGLAMGPSGRGFGDFPYL